MLEVLGNVPMWVSDSGAWIAFAVGCIAIVSAIAAAARWLDRRNEVTTRRVLIGDPATGSVGVLVPAVEAAVKVAVQPIRDEQVRVYDDLRAHMTEESGVLAAQADAHAQHIEDDREFQEQIQRRLEDDAKAASEDRTLMLGLLRDALHGQVDPHPPTGG